MSSRRTPFAQAAAVLLTTAILLALACSSKRSSAQSFTTTDLQLDLKTPFRFVAYGDTRFHGPKDTEAANPPVRVALVRAIADVNPAFICFTAPAVRCPWQRVRSPSGFWPSSLRSILVSC